MDDLLDLNFTSPVKPQVGGTASGLGGGGVQRMLNGTPVNAPNSNKADAFDFLLNPTGPSDSISKQTGIATAGSSRPGSAAPALLQPTPSSYGNASSIPGYKPSTSASVGRMGTPGTAPINSTARLAEPLRPSSGLSMGMGGTTSSSSRAAGIASTSTPRPTNGTTPVPSAQAQSRSDAFGDLFALSGGPSSLNGRGQNQSLADRQAQMEREKREKAERERRQFDFDGGFLDGLGGGAGSGVTGAGSALAGSGHSINSRATGAAGHGARAGTPQPTILAPQPLHASTGKGSFWDTDFASSSAPAISNAKGGAAAAPPAHKALARIGGGRLDTPPVQRTGSSAAPAIPDDPFDFDALARATPGAGASAGAGRGNGLKGGGTNGRERGNETGRGTGLMDGDDEDDEDDFLGQLGRPAAQTSRGARDTHGSAGGFTQDEDDDLLGELGRPAPQRRPSPPIQRQSPSLPHSRPDRSKRPSSPPPHIIGQIVEMGYSPAQARQALAATADGVDVQAAMEILLSGIVDGGGAGSSGSNGGGGGHEGERHRPARGLAQSRGSDGEDGFEEDGDEDFVERERDRRQQQQRQQRQEEASEAERRRARRAGPSRASVQPRTRDERARDDEILGGDSGRNGDRDRYAEGNDTDKYIQQATAIGTSMLGKASSLWAVGKEKAQKLYEEQKRNYEAQQRAMAAASEAEGRGEQPAGGRRGEQRGGGGGGGGGDGRPRWMVDAQYEPGPGEERVNAAGGDGGGFRDGDDSDEDGHGALPRHPSERQSRPSQPAPAQARDKQFAPQESASDMYRSVKERADSLFADPPRNYVPAHRRKPAPAPARATAHAQAAARFERGDVPNRPASRPNVPVPARAATPLIKRSIVSAPPASLSAANTSKAAGNEHFKLGRFAEAETAYSASISRLPPGHLGLVALYNNRATARLKLGEWSGAVDDCSAALGIIGASYHPSKEEPLPQGDKDSADVKLAEGLVKAYTKRAQAREMGEKYKEALEDWEKVVALSADQAFGSAGGSAGALEGVRRAKKMLAPPASGNAASGHPAGASASASASASSTRKPIPKASTAGSKPKSQPQTSASAHMNTENSAGVSQMRAAAHAAAKENDERLAVQDSVDAKIASWKGGKETNLRALIASLETVLWPGIMGGANANANGGGGGGGGGGPSLKVGMHELISEKQVKVKYMRVVGRLHPDKLSTSNTTVEQRLIANAVFGALSEAWQALQNGS